MSRLNIRWRITLWNTAAFALVLLAFGALVYTQLLSTHYAQLDARLRGRLHQLAADAPSSESLGHWAQQISAQVEGGVAILDPDGKIVAPASSEWVDERLPKNLATTSEFKTVQMPNGRTARRFIGPLDVGDATYTVVMFADLAHVNEEMALVARVLLITVPLALVAAASLGYFLARKALAPIEQLRTRTDEITAAHLDRRLPVPNPRDELGLLTKTINAMIERLDKSFREIRRFTADASHELRTPVTVIRSEAELGLKNAAPGDARNRFSSILEECATLSWTTEQLLALCREDAGIDLPTMQRVDLKSLVLGVVDTMRPLAAAKRQVLLANELDEASVLGCPQRLRQVVTNLLDNAIKYTPEEGRIAVTLAATEGDARITIEDTGPGIAVDDRAHIFDRFFRGASHKAQVEGAGLGLSIVQSVVAVHGGRVDVDCEAGRGSLFRVLLPLGPSASAAEIQAASNGGRAPR